MAKIEIYTSNNCPYCMAAKKLLTELGQTFHEISVEKADDLREKMVALTGRRTVPQILINGQPIGGFDDLSGLHKSGELQEILDRED